MTSDDDDDGPCQQNEGSHFSVAPSSHTWPRHTLLKPKMKEITIYKISHWTLWPDFAIVVFLASEGHELNLHLRAFFSPDIPHIPKVRAYQLVSKRKKTDNETNRKRSATLVLIQPMNRSMVTRNSDSLRNYRRRRELLKGSTKQRESDKNREHKHATTIEI